MATTTPVKTYVLMDHMNPTIPVRVQVSRNQGVRITARKSWQPFLRQTFIDADGQGKTARFKLNAKSIWQDEQIAQNIPANAKFTNRERDMVKFRHGFLVTNVGILQEYLESVPQFEGFKGEPDPSNPPCYKIHDADAIEKQVDDKNQKIRSALEKIYTASFDDLEAELMRINGVWSDIPKTIEARRNKLADLLETEAGVDAIIDARKDEDKVHDQRRVWIGRLMKIGILDFEKEPGLVYKKGTKNNMVKVFETSASYSREDRVSLFVEFLQTEKGKPIVDDLLKQEDAYNKTQADPKDQQNQN